MKLTSKVTFDDKETFVTTTEVVEMSNTTLDPPLFEMPTNCRVIESYGPTGVRTDHK